MADDTLPERLQDAQRDTDYFCMKAEINNRRAKMWKAIAKRQYKKAEHFKKLLLQCIKPWRG